MKKLLFILLPVLLGLHSMVPAQFRSGIFLHHSTGGCIWGPNGSSTGIPQEMEAYNALHGLAGSQAVGMNEEWWAPEDNEWVRWHNFFEDPSPANGIGYYLPGNKIIVIKSCFPSSSMSGAGTPDDTIYPDMKTVYNYKWHWRHICNVVRSHPANFFVIWTNAPQEPGSTNAGEASLSNWFCTWAKDTLAAGLDLVSGPPPPNLFVFDYFHKVAGPDGMELVKYRAGPGDSHPNAAATAHVAPQFVSEIFDAAIAYENIYGIPGGAKGNQAILQSSPNPFTEETVIRFTITGQQPAELALSDVSGYKLKTLWTGTRKGCYKISLHGGDLPHAVYLLQLIEGSNKTICKLVH